MGRKGGWLVALKRVFSPESKEKKGHQKTNSSKRRWGCGGGCADSLPPESLENSAPGTPLPAPPKPPIPEEIKLVSAENERSEHAYSVALATAVVAEAAAVAAQAAAEVARLTSSARFSPRSGAELAAIKIQTAFRGYMARRALRALRGLVRLKSLVNSNAVKRQTVNTLRCMQTLARVQSQVRSRRIRMTEENHALQRQLQLKRERELEKLRTGEEWDDSFQSKEQMEANLLSKQEAAIRRERALAYAYSRQAKNSSRSMGPMFMDPDNPQWGWSWLERWMSARPWESRSMMDHAAGKSGSHSIGGEITKAYARRDVASERTSSGAQKPSRPPSRQSPLTPPSKASSTTGRAIPASPRSGWGPLEDDAGSMLSLQSVERRRRHSIAGSSVRDDESLASSTAMPSYMTPTQSAKARSRFQSPSGDKIETLETVSVGPVRKRLSFSPADKHSLPSPARVRRHSGPPKVDVASLQEVSVRPDF